VGLEDDGRGVHIDFALGIAPLRAALAQLPGGLDRAQRFVPKHDFSARFLPQTLGEIAKLLVPFFAMSAAGDADHDRFGVEFRGDTRKFVDDLSFVPDHRVRTGDRSGIAHRHADAASAVIDGNERHAADCTWHYAHNVAHSNAAMKNFNLDAILDAMLKMSYRVSDL